MRWLCSETVGKLSLSNVKFRYICRPVHVSWCSLFSEGDMGALEYSVDMKTYWKRGALITCMCICSTTVDVWAVHLIVVLMLR